VGCSRTHPREARMMRQFMYYVPASMRARLLARRHAQDEALGASPGSPFASAPGDA